MGIDLLLVVICGLITILLISGTNKIIGYSQKKQIENKKLELESPKNNVPENYDPHYTRDLEIQQGLRVATQCDDIACTTCYWKARKMIGNPAFNSVSITRKHNEFIDNLPDGCSDELYDSMLADWFVEMRVEIKAQEAITKRIEEKKRQEIVSQYHCTPYALVQQYKAEGRVFNKQSNSWSAPLIATQLTSYIPTNVSRNSRFQGGMYDNGQIQWTKAEQKILDNNKAHWKKKLLKPVKSNPVVIDDFDELMVRDAGMQALKSGRAMIRETNLLLIEAKQKGIKEQINVYEAEVKEWREHMQKLKASLDITLNRGMRTEEGVPTESELFRDEYLIERY